jgi:hypothetical protein
MGSSIHTHSVDSKLAKMTVGYGISYTATKIHRHKCKINIKRKIQYSLPMLCTCTFKRLILFRY